MEHSASRGTESNQNMCMMYVLYDVLQRIFGNNVLDYLEIKKKERKFVIDCIPEAQRMDVYGS